MPEGTRVIDRSKKRTRAKPVLGCSRFRPVLCPGRDFMVPQSIQQVGKLARMIALAEWASPSLRDLEGNYVLQRIELAIMHGATVGLGPIAAVQSIALINGMPTIWGDGALALVERSGLLEDMIEQYEFDEEEGLTAICTMKRRHRPTPITNRFSIAMADQARLTQKEGPWKTYPQRMLRMRARSWALRDGFADVLRGLHIREELDDFVVIKGMRQSPATVPQETPPEGLRAWGSRPKLSAGSGSPTPSASEATSTKPQVKPGAERGQPMLEEPGAEEIFTLVNADGAFIDIIGKLALHARFEEVFFDPHLSAGQIVGLWESNELARGAIAGLLGADALASATERFETAQTARNRECQVVSPEPASCSAG